MNIAVIKINQLFLDFGENTYGEACSQTTHAISCAMHAQNEDADLAMIVAAFLHDIGHFIADKEQLLDFDEWGHKDHAKIGSDWLKKLGFPASVYEPIRYHVEAKRYLYTIQTPVSLSRASATTLYQQGGLMSAEQIQLFEQSSYYKQAVCLRRYDDMGKPTEAVDEELAPWLAFVEQILEG